MYCGSVQRSRHVKPLASFSLRIIVPFLYLYLGIAEIINTNDKSKSKIMDTKGQLYIVSFKDHTNDKIKIFMNSYYISAF